MDELIAEMRRYDPYTASHGTRVAGYAELIGRMLGLSEPDLAEVRCAALLHDIGKLWIPLPLLRKTGPLDDREMELMRRHAAYGAAILVRVGQARCAALVNQHHERIDGLGYPAGRRGSEIHLHARIVAVADVYDAMTSDRSYRRALGRPAADTELRRVAGTQLDAALVDAFLEAQARERARARRILESRPG